MKTFVTKEKQSAPAVRKTRPYVHHPMGPVQLAQQAEVRRILRSTGAQAKLTIGQPNDKYEQEADRVADHVIRMSDADVAQRQPVNEEEEETLQAKHSKDDSTGVKYLVESVRAPSGLCFWGAMQMLMRYHRRRFGLSTFTAFDDMVQSGAVPKAMLNASGIQDLVERHGLAWGYMPGNKRILEQVLSLVGPLIYVCHLAPAGSIFQHSVLITGIEDGSLEPNILFNDPGDGGKKTLPFSRFFLGYPPYMKNKSGDKTLIIWGGNRRPNYL